RPRLAHPRRDGEGARRSRGEQAVRRPGTRGGRHAARRVREVRRQAVGVDQRSGEEDFLEDQEVKHAKPWLWPEKRWRGIVNRVRAGRSLRPPRWPGAARCALALSFDSDHETNELRDGGES